MREVIDLYGRTGRFDVIAITDHILMKNDLLARAGRLATLGRRSFGVAEDQFDAYLDDIAERGRARARASTACSSSPAPRSRRTGLRGKKNSHIIALDIKRVHQRRPARRAILREIRRQDALSIACHPHHRTTRRIEISTCYLWDHRDELSDLVDVWEAANRDDLFSVTSLKHFPYVANSDFHKPKHLYSWKTLLRVREDVAGDPQRARANVDVALTLFRAEAWAGSASAVPDRTPVRSAVGRGSVALRPASTS